MRDVANCLLALVFIPVAMGLMVVYAVWCVAMFCQFVVEEFMANEVS